MPSNRQNVIDLVFAVALNEIQVVFAPFNEILLSSTFPCHLINLIEERLQVSLKSLCDSKLEQMISKSDLKRIF